MDLALCVWSWDVFRTPKWLVTVGRWVYVPSPCEIWTDCLPLRAGKWWSNPWRCIKSLLRTAIGEEKEARNRTVRNCHLSCRHRKQSLPVTLGRKLKGRCLSLTSSMSSPTISMWVGRGRLNAQWEMVVEVGWCGCEAVMSSASGVCGKVWERESAFCAFSATSCLTKHSFLTLSHGFE